MTVSSSPPDIPSSDSSVSDGQSDSLRSLEEANLVPAATDRALFVGQTGSGKTTLARELLKTRRFVVVIDSKGTLNWPEYTRATTARELMKLGNKPVEFPRLLYRPSYEEMQNEETQEAVWSWLYRRGSCTLYVDELAAVSDGDRAPAGYGAGLMRGRETGIEVWSGTQRPSKIPSIALSESEHTYCFYLRLRRDRVRVEELAGIEEDRIAELAKRSFIYASQEAGIAGPFRLRLR